MADDTPKRPSPKRPSPKERERQRNLRMLEYYKDKGEIITPVTMSRFSQLLAEEPLFMVPKNTKSPRHRDTRADSAQLSGGVGVRVEDGGKPARQSLRESLRNAPILNREGRIQMANDLGAGKSPELADIVGRRRRMANGGAAGRRRANDPATVVPEEEDDDFKSGISPASDPPVVAAGRWKRMPSDGEACRRLARDPAVPAPEEEDNDLKAGILPAGDAPSVIPRRRKKKTNNGTAGRQLTGHPAVPVPEEEHDDLKAGILPASDAPSTIPGRRKKKTNNGTAGRQMAGHPASVVPEEEDDDLKAGILPTSEAPSVIPGRRKKKKNNGTVGRQRVGDPPVVAPERRKQTANDGKDKRMPSQIPTPKKPDPEQPRTEPSDPTHALVLRRLQELEDIRWVEMVETAHKADPKIQEGLFEKLGLELYGDDPNDTQANDERWVEILRRRGPHARRTEEQEHNRQVIESMMYAPDEADPAKVIEQFHQLKVGTNSGRS